MLWLLLVYSHLVQGGCMSGECVCSFLDSFATELIAEGRARCWALSPSGLSISHAASVYRRKDRDNPCGVSLRDTHICVGVRDRDFCVYAEGRKLIIHVDYWLQIQICVCISQTMIKKVWTFKQHWWECEMVLPFWKTFWQIFKMSNLELGRDPAIPLMYKPKHLCTHVYSSTISSSRNGETTQETINKWSENWYTQCGPSAQWNMTQPWKGVELWHRLQCGWTLNTQHSVREGDTKGYTVYDSIYRNNSEQANPQRMKVGLWWLGDRGGEWVDGWRMGT